MSERADVVVIGGGTNGLAAAAVLARAGRRVTLLERAHRVGGQTRSEEFAPGFHFSLAAFDGGWVPPSVAAATRLRMPALAAPDVSVSLATPGGDDSLFSLPVSSSRAETFLRHYSPEDSRRWREFTRLLRAQSTVLEQLYQLPPPRIDMASAAELFPLFGLAAGLRLGGAQRVVDLLSTLPIPVYDLLNDWFAGETLRAAIAAGGVQGIRQGVRSGGTTFVLIHNLVGAHEESVRSRPYFLDGPDVLAELLLRVLRTRGVDVRTSATVTQVLIEGYRVRGVLLDSGENIGCDHVISTADPATTFLDLVDAAWLDPDLRHAVVNIRMRGCSGYVCYGVAELPAALAAAQQQDALKAVISLTPSLDGIERAYDAVKYGSLAPTPHVEIAVPTARWPALAPAGQHVIMARAHYVPHGFARDTMASRVDGAVEAVFPGFLSRVLHRVALAPADVAERYAVREGSLSHGELTLDQVLFMRPLPALSQYCTPIDGLFLGGSGCHPGPGADGSAGVLAARALLRGQRG